MGAEPGDPLTHALLERGVAAGVITPAQRDALLALLALLALPAADATDAPPARESARESARGALDPVTIAYVLGAALVVFALGWFLADKWGTLGPSGVLLVSLGYAALFGGVAAQLARTRYPLAAGVALALATLTAPLAAWALLRLAGEWPDARGMRAMIHYEPLMATRRLVVELSNVLAVLLAVRFVRADRVRRTPLAIPLAAATGLALGETTTLVAIGAAGLDQLWSMRGWAYAAAGAILFGVAYETDRRQPPPGDARREDFAGWLYLGACLVFEAGLLGLFGDARAVRHGLPLVALAQLAASVRLRRRALLVAGMGNAIWYLGYLAFDVFEDVLSFPFLLAAFGVAVLVMTVVVQRRFPSLVRRAPADGIVPRLPGGPLAAWAPAALAVALLALQVPHARRRAVERERERREARAVARQRVRESPPRPAR